MPELPDITVYVEALRDRLSGHQLASARLGSPFLLRTVDPPLSVLIGRRVSGVERMGKRIIVALDDDYFIVLHLMIAGRLHWTARGAKGSRRASLAAFDFDSGTLTLTEAGSKRRASLYLVRGRAALAEHDRGGLEVHEASPAEFAARLRLENHTLKRALTDPRLFSGIGNAYSDEILHRARLSPVKLTSRLTDDEVARLFDATRAILTEWTDRLRAEAGGDFPENVTAFRPEMAVHGKFRQPCPVCGTPIQRIRYADNETNYCPTCQTDGKLLADRALSRILKGDWPKNLDEWETQTVRKGGQQRADADGEGD
ncbi:MAG TPA: DNA-formamidopyrimidine glycosylase family protein [Gemmatimonadaceae bacterium]|nr:DNA-formamidopyrimidine glycosylase family protein [Gemmatimonadaceae bacterium]